MRLALLLLKKASEQAAKSKPQGRDDWRWGISGLKWSEIKKHYSIIPMYGLTFVAMCMAGGYVLRLATQHPEVSWTKQNPEPWNDYKGRQYKFVASGRDYSKGSSAPPF